MGFAALSTGVSALSATQRAQDVSAHNIANASTRGFQPQQANFQESAPAGNGVSLSTSARALSAADAGDNGGGSNLSVDVTNSLVYKAQFNAAAAVVKTADSTLGSLIDTKA
ncbi:flagellar basal body protein [Rugamonas sp.]|uniref:flagellar basal body protein n=1 Tax=Rugamonas sp. TaxID=1926287 RepID=UPI0025F9B95C|nr:flagellar basal body protein [Rugamonas sp.]